MIHTSVLIVFLAGGLVSASSDRLGTYRFQHRDLELPLQRRLLNNGYSIILPRTPGSSLSRIRQERSAAKRAGAVQTSNPLYDPNAASSSTSSPGPSRPSVNQKLPDASAGVSHWGPGKAWTKIEGKRQNVDVPQSDHNSDEAGFTRIVNHPKKASAGGKLKPHPHASNPGLSAWSTGTHNSVELQLDPGSRGRIGTYQADGTHDTQQYRGPGTIIGKPQSNIPGTQMSTAIELEGGGKVKAKGWNEKP